MTTFTGFKTFLPPSVPLSLCGRKMKGCGETSGLTMNTHICMIGRAFNHLSKRELKGDHFI